MITKENRENKICSFYASDYHLEMIMLPYINKKLEKGANIIILTERDLTETVRTVISKMNMPKQRKDEILKLDWSINNCKKIKQIKNMNKEKESIIFIIGRINYIKDINSNIQEIVRIGHCTIVDCYSILEVKQNMVQIVETHSKILNTTEEKNLG